MIWKRKKPVDLKSKSYYLKKGYKEIPLGFKAKISQGDLDYSEGGFDRNNYSGHVGVYAARMEVNPQGKVKISSLPPIPARAEFPIKVKAEGTIKPGTKLKIGRTPSPESSKDVLAVRKRTFGSDQETEMYLGSTHKSVSRMSPPDTKSGWKTFGHLRIIRLKDGTVLVKEDPRHNSLYLGFKEKRQKSKIHLNL